MDLMDAVGALQDRLGVGVDLGEREDAARPGRAEDPLPDADTHADAHGDTDTDTYARGEGDDLPLPAGKSGQLQDA